VAGLFDALHPGSQCFGFLNGPDGIVKNRHKLLTAQEIDSVRNQGGFDLLGSGRTKIETPEQFEKALKACSNLDGLVIIGGDDSNTNAALLSEYFEKNGCKTCVVGVPKTIDGDLKSEFIEASFGFDTASKTYSAAIGSLLRDALSAKKYTFFIKVMGRTASHIALECALETHANLTLISEERLSLQEIVKKIADVIRKRAEMGKNYGAIIIPEGLFEFIQGFVPPEGVGRDPHGNIEVSKIETERLLIDLVKRELKDLEKFSPVPISLGYEGRSCLPSNFDANYCYALGTLAARLIQSDRKGTMAALKNLAKPPEEWEPLGVPLAKMMHLEERHGVMKPVIKKALVDLQGPAFLFFKENRDSWALNDDYHYPGPIQFYGPTEIADSITLTLKLESQQFNM